MDALQAVFKKIDFSKCSKLYSNSNYNRKKNVLRKNLITKKEK